MSTVAKRPYRMDARAEAARETAERILDAAIAAFLERPTDRLSLAEIASRADTTKQTILRHFGSKDGLFAAAAKRAFAQVEAERGEVEPGDVARAVAVLVAHYERVGDGVVRMLAEEERSPVLAQIAERGRELHASWCERVFAPALARSSGVERERRLAQLVAVCDVYTWRLLRRVRGLSRRQAELALVELVEYLAGERR